MATQQQPPPQQQGARRLTIRGLRERQRPAIEAMAAEEVAAWLRRGCVVTPFKLQQLREVVRGRLATRALSSYASAREVTNEWSDYRTETLPTQRQIEDRECTMAECVDQMRDDIVDLSQVSPYQR